MEGKTRINRIIRSVFGGVLIFNFVFISCNNEKSDDKVDYNWYSIGLEGISVNKFISSDNYLFALTGPNGLWRLNPKNINSEWENLGFTNSSSSSLIGVNDILIDNYNSDKMLITIRNSDTDSSDHFVFKSFDKGNSWEPADSGLINIYNGIVRKKRIYLLEQFNDFIMGTGYHDGFYKTTDFGGYWEKLDTTVAIDGWVLEKHPTDENIVWYGGQDAAWRSRLFFSENKGTDWEEIRPYPVLGGDSKVDFIALDQDNQNTVVVHTYSELVKSMDMGSTWDTLSLKVLQNLVYNESDNEYYYASMLDTLYSSTDGGYTWSVIDSPNEENIISLFFDLTTERLYLSSEEGIFYYGAN